jgi:hypothetical protein
MLLLQVAFFDDGSQFVGLLAAGTLSLGDGFLLDFAFPSPSETFESLSSTEKGNTVERYGLTIYRG